MVKKKIVLAGMWRRIAAHGIDLGCILGLSALFYFTLVIRIAIDPAAINANNAYLAEGQLNSGLFFGYSNGAVGTPFDNGNFTSLSQPTTTKIVKNGESYTIHPLNMIFDYYTQNRASFFDDKPNLTVEGTKESIFLVGKESSNIASIAENDAGHYVITLLDNSRASYTLSFVHTVWRTASDELMTSTGLAAANADNNSRQLFMIWMAAPTVACAALVFEFFVPLFLPYGKTLGKLALKLVVLNGAGYEIKRIQLLPRALVYIATELIGGVLSFGALFIISYTMTMFSKKHRSFHDLVAYTVVADERESLWFKNRVDEEEWLNEHKESFEDYSSAE